MKGNIPQKPDEEWLEHLKANYTYDRDKGYVISNKTGKPALGANSHGYQHVSLRIKGLQKKIRAHHAVWYFEYGEWPTSTMDHIDGDKTNNHFSNLRLVTNRENIQAYRIKQSCSSVYQGVCWKKSNKKWCSQIGIEGKNIYLGHFTCELEAARVYDRALVELGLKPVNVEIMKEQQND